MFKFLDLIKYFFPSWCFFDEAYETPSLLFKTDKSAKWIPALTPKKTQLHHLFFNPQINIYLSLHSHLLKLVDELYHHQKNQNYQWEKSTNYQLVHNIVKAKIKTEFFTYAGKYSFILAMIDKDQNIIETLMESPEYEIPHP